MSSGNPLLSVLIFSIQYSVRERVNTVVVTDLGYLLVAHTQARGVWPGSPRGAAVSWMSPSVNLRLADHQCSSATMACHAVGDIDHLVQSSPPTSELVVNVVFVYRGLTIVAIMTILLVYIVTSANGLEYAWPIMPISRYAAHAPAVYVWRVVMGTSATLICASAPALWRRSRAVCIFQFAAGTGLALLTSVSYLEHRPTHQAFANIFFIGAVLMQLPFGYEATRFAQGKPHKIKTRLLDHTRCRWPKCIAALSMMAVCILVALLIFTIIKRHVTVATYDEALGALEAIFVFEYFVFIGVVSYSM